MENFEENFLKRYDSGNPNWTYDEIQEMCWGGYGEEIEQQIVEQERWTTLVTTIFKIGDRYFGIDWYRGNTECQENDYDGATPFEVERKEVVTYKYVPKADNETVGKEDL